MLNLIKNEYIKVLKKKSSIVFACILVLLSIGMQGIIKLEMKYMSGDQSYGEFNIDDNIEDANTDAAFNPESEKEVDLWTAAKKMDVTGYDDWKYNMLSSVQEMSVDSSNGSYDSKKFNGYVDKIIGKSFGEVINILADDVQDKKYTSEELDDPITNSFKYLCDLGVEDSDDWRVEKATLLVSLQDSIESGMLEKGTSDYDKAFKNLNIIRYALDNNEKYYVTDDTQSSFMNGGDAKQDSFWITLISTTGILTVLSIIMIVVAGSTVAGEFATGTIKFFLINPVKRGKLIFSKYFMVVSFSALLTILAYVVNVIICIVLNGISPAGASYISYSDGSIHSYSALLYLALLYVFKFIGVIVYETMAFSISSIFKSSAMSIGLGIGCMAFGSIITNLLYAFNMDWGRYLMFANTDLKAVSDGQVMFANMTVGFSVAVLAVHMIVFLLAAYDGFVRREV